MLRILFFFLFSHVLYANPILISMDAKDVKLLNKHNFANKVIKKSKEINLLEIKESDLVRISAMMHEEKGVCGGFFFEESKNINFNQLMKNKTAQTLDYKISQEKVVKELIEQVEEKNIRETIEYLSSFQNRYYKSSFGVDSQNGLKNKWSELVKNRDDASVSLVAHTFLQPSVELRIKGAKYPEEFVVIGGHADSINGWMWDLKARAPGADDNASGMASITEIIRVLVDSHFKPDRTLIFYGYAAEEVGLKGSAEIAKHMRDINANIKGVMQLDMTNYSADSTEMIFVTDHVNPSLNAFGHELAKTYLPSIEVLEEECGYACSDHASWTRYNYPSWFPFESLTPQMSPYIHTEDDTIAQSGNNANHAVPFSKIGIAFAVEMSSVL